MAKKVKQLKPRPKQRPKRKKAGQKPQSYDYIILFVVITLVFFGIIMIFSSSYYYTLTDADFNNDMYYFLKKQLQWAALGFIGMAITMRLPIVLYKRFSFLAYIFANILLMLLPFIGTEANGQKRWIFGFQPSEVAKVSIILFMSYYISTHKDCLKDLKGFIKTGIILGIPIVLIAVSNLSTAIVVTAIGAAILFVASPKIWYFIVGGVIAGIGGVVAVTLPQFAYRFSRIKTWLDPFSDMLGSGYQIVQGLYAVASGGVFGLGLGQSRQKTFIPEAYTDIIFAIICEELGLVGAIVIISLFAILIWRGIKIALNSPDMFNCLVAVGITTMIGFQALVNIAVVTNTIPNTGQPLPFISYGGTSLLLTMASVGILLNISRYCKTDE